MEPSGPKPERAVEEVRLEDGLEQEHHRCLYNPVTDRGNTERSFLAVRLRDLDALHRVWPIGLAPEILADPRQQFLDAVLRIHDVVHRNAVDAGCATAFAAAHRLPGRLQNIIPKEMPIERVQPELRLPFGLLAELET